MGWSTSAPSGVTFNDSTSVTATKKWNHWKLTLTVWTARKTNGDLHLTSLGRGACRRHLGERRLGGMEFIFIFISVNDAQLEFVSLTLRAKRDPIATATRRVAAGMARSQSP